MKTKTQQRALAGEKYRGPLETLHRLLRGECTRWFPFFCLTKFKGPDPKNPKPILPGLARLYRGLGVSATRSVTTHGLLWTILDAIAGWIDRRPLPTPRLS